MRKLDLIVGIVGGIVLVAALAGAYREGSTGSAPAGTHELQWSTRTVELGTKSGPEAVFNVTAQNLTLVTFTVTLTGDQTFLSPNGDPIEVTVTPPEGSGLNATTATGSVSTLGRTTTITVETRVQGIPSVGVAQGATGVQALRDLAATQTSTKGMGDWTVTVAISRSAAVGNVAIETVGSAESYEATLKTPSVPAPAQR